MSALLDNTFGALLLGTFVSLPLYGITLAQTVEYFRLYPSDRRFLKVFVVAIFISDTLHSTVLIHICYHYLVTDYLAPGALLVNVWSMDILPLSIGTSVLLTQGFYARRIYIVAGVSCLKYRLLVFSVVLLLFAECGFVIANTVVNFRSSTILILHHSTGWMNLASFTIATGVDLVLTSAFVVIMRQMRARTGFEGTDTALKLLARYTMFASVLVSALAIPTFVCSLVLRHSFVYFAISIPATKVYTSSVLAVLNCRKFLPSPGSLNLNVTDDSEEGNIRINILQDGHTLQGVGGGGNPKPVAARPRQRHASSSVVIDISLVRKHQELGGAEGWPGETNAA